MSEDLRAFEWQTQPAATALLEQAVADTLARCPAAAQLADRLLHESGTRFRDWIDYLHVPADELPAWQASGFRAHHGGLRHPGGRFPLIAAGPRAVTLRVDSVADCCAALGINAPIIGDPGPGLRRAQLAAGDGVTLWVSERLGWSGVEPTTCEPSRLASAIRHLERFRCRPRQDDDGFARTRALIARAVGDLGQEVACDLFFAAERDFWQRRNAAARVQKARQDALGMGWANHDHHTYRSSRAGFTTLIACLEDLGFTCRERFYAGREAGWGAQVLEQPLTGIVIFADVDLSVDEVRGDFAHQPLPDQRQLGTVGLWCALHGEAFLAAGMHHLEATFAFDQARAQLAAAGVPSMKPFTDLPHLRQCFTIGERWPVARARLDRLRQQGLITAEQAEQFHRDGALGSHLELLERNLGFKGFNQHGVSEIIAATDPRKS